MQGSDASPASSVAARPSDTLGSALPIQADPDVRAAIGRIRRTEDIRFSPDDRRLAVVDYSAECLHLFEVDLSPVAAGGGVALRGCCVLKSPTFRSPHGVAFLGATHLVVSNRKAGVDILRLPEPAGGVREVEVEPLARIRGHGGLGGRVKTPGSVDVTSRPDGTFLVWVCNNRWDTVTSHIVRVGRRIRITHEGVRIERGLRLPDGISVSPDRRWIAVSNHAHGQALVYANEQALDRRSTPAAVLGGSVCPHGLRFSADGRRLFVADAASRHVHVYEARDGAWPSVAQPDASIPLVDPDTFHRGRYDAREGGIKGLTLDRSGQVLAVTHRHGVLTFHDVPGLLRAAAGADPAEMQHLCEVRDRSLTLDPRHASVRRWTVGARLKHAVGPRRKMRKLARWVRRNAGLVHLRLRNRHGRASVLEAGGPTVSMTTHGARVPLAFYAIESIALGRRRPARMTLWLPTHEFETRPQSLRRLERRGLEVHPTDDLGPHTKYYPLAREDRALQGPVVTADDDVLYPPWWLERLIEAYERQPNVIHCHRAHRMDVGPWHFAPYSSWGPCRSPTPSHLNLITGVSGAIYPAEFLRHVARQGTPFLASCPKADDIWLTVNALRARVPVAQVDAVSKLFPGVPGTARQRLSLVNVVEGGNQEQLLDTFTSADLDALRRALVEEGA